MGARGGQSHLYVPRAVGMELLPLSLNLKAKKGINFHKQKCFMIPVFSVVQVDLKYNIRKSVFSIDFAVL